jgi:hypothetical protein
MAIISRNPIKSDMSYLIHYLLTHFYINPFCDESFQLIHNNNNNNNNNKGVEWCVLIYVCNMKRVNKWDIFSKVQVTTSFLS